MIIKIVGGIVLASSFGLAAGFILHALVAIYSLTFWGIEVSASLPVMILVGILVSAIAWEFFGKNDDAL